MAHKIYIGNLSYDTTEKQIEELINKSGKVESINIITDKVTGKSKGFAFAEMSSDEDANKAIAEANGVELDGRQIKVNIAKRPKRRNYPMRNDYDNDRFSRSGSYNSRKRKGRNTRRRY